MKNNFGTLKSSINFAIIPDEISKKRYNSRKFSKTHKSITNREESQTNKNKLTFREQDSRDISQKLYSKSLGAPIEPQNSQRVLKEHRLISSDSPTCQSVHTSSKQCTQKIFYNPNGMFENTGHRNGIRHNFSLKTSAIISDQIDNKYISRLERIVGKDTHTF